MLPRDGIKAGDLLLETKGLAKSYSGRRVVDSVSFKVHAGEIVGLLGPNGAGKSTSFRMTIGLVRPDEGSVSLLGKECSKLPMYKRARLGMGYLPQEPSIFRRMTVEGNILAVLCAARFLQPPHFIVVLVLGPLPRRIKVFVQAGHTRAHLHLIEIRFVLEG